MHGYAAEKDLRGVVIERVLPVPGQALLYGAAVGVKQREILQVDDIVA